jgi:hypothetical protein
MVNRFKFDYVAFELLLIKACRNFIIYQRAKQPAAFFYWYGLDTYEEFGWLRFIMVSEQDLDKEVEHRFTQHRDWYQDMNRNDLRWYLRYDTSWAKFVHDPDEAGNIEIRQLFEDLDHIISKGGSQFNGTYVTAREAWGEEKAREHVQPFIDQFRAVCISTLKQLDQEGFFGSGAARDNAIVTFKLYDNIEWDDIVALNPPAAIIRYRTQLAKGESFEFQVYRNKRLIPQKQR